MGWSCMSYYQNHYRRVITLTSLFAYLTFSPLGFIMCSTAVYLSLGNSPACLPHGINKFIQLTFPSAHLSTIPCKDESIIAITSLNFCHDGTFTMKPCIAQKSY